MAKKKATAQRVTNKPVAKPKTTTASTTQPAAERRAADAELSRLVLAQKSQASWMRHWL